MAKTNSTPNSRETPIVMRWAEELTSGKRTWFLAALKLDRQFWGYVHIRTDELSENRSFVGQLDELKYRQVRDILDAIHPEINDSDGTYWDGVLGRGTRSNFVTLIRYRSGLNQLPNSCEFQEIISVVHPELMLASDLIAG